MRPKAPRIRANFTLTEKALAAIEDIAEERGTSCSTVVEQMARDAARQRADAGDTSQTQNQGKRK